MDPNTQKKPRRPRLTLAERLQPIDESIRNHETAVVELRARRQDLIIAEEARARAVLQAVEDAQAEPLSVLPLTAEQK